MKKFVIKLLSALLYMICLVLGVRVGIAILRMVDRIIAPKVSPIIHEIPVFAIGIYILLLLLLIKLAIYLVNKIDLQHLELLFFEQFMKKLLLMLLIGFSFGFAYWISLQIFVIVVLFVKESL